MLETLTFGVEIECHIPQGTGIHRENYHARRPMRHAPDSRLAPLDGWRAESDGSLRAPDGRIAIEFISPVLRGLAGLRAVHAAITCLKETVGANTNETCGTHIHVSFPSGDTDAVRRLLHIVGKHEAGLFAACGTPRRMSGYSQGIRQVINPAQLNFRVERNRNSYGSGSLVCDADLGNRYRAINLSSWMSGGPTVEFRLWSNTVNANKVVTWVRLSVGMVEKALSTTRRAKWTHADTALVKSCKGDAPKALKLLMYDMGWIKGRSFVRDRDNPNADNFGRIPVVWGNMVGDGLPSIEESHRLLKRLAESFEEKRRTGVY